MNQSKKIMLIALLSFGLTIARVEANACCGFMQICEMILNLGAGAGMAIFPGAAAAFDPTALPLRGAGVALFIRGVRQLCFCCSSRDKTDAIANRVVNLENRNVHIQNKLSKAEIEVAVIKEKLKNVSQ